MAVKRKDVLVEDQWDLNSLYPSIKNWKDELEKLCPSGKPKWPEILSDHEAIKKGPEHLKTLLDTFFTIDRQLSKLYTYVARKQDEDLSNEENKQALSLIFSLLQQFHERISWIEPEILALDEAVFSEYLNSKALAPYHFFLEKLHKLKAHTLSADKEMLLAMTSKAFQAAPKAFEALNNADFKFGKVKDEKNEDHELTHASYNKIIRSHDRTLRKNAFKAFHQVFKEHENGLAELLKGAIEHHVFVARARSYPTSLEAALYPNNIPTSVYRSLIEAVNEKLPVLHKYLDVRKKILNVGPLHLYDMYVPLTSDVHIEMSYKEAEDVIIEAVAPLGHEYQTILKKGFREEGWVDRYENEGKRSGAYSSGCYDSHPYILMNFKGTLRDVFTLAHEAGHSMHTHLSKSQPYQYHSYPIFLAEVASTLNEELLMRHLLNKFTKREEKIYLINEKIEDIRGTLFRQTMFAEFELLIHEKADKNEPLTPGIFKEIFHTLNRKYFGPEVVIDEEALPEWSRIPHFYYNFYVYQYATGISAALAIAKNIFEKGNQKEVLNFLKSGGSLYPIDALAKVGVDLRTKAPIISALETFENLVAEMDRLIQSKN